MEFTLLLALPLPEALESLEAEGFHAAVASTAPPFFPRGYTPHWGSERVLRVRQTEEGRVELLVGRELIGEERHEKTTASG